MNYKTMRTMKIKYFYHFYASLSFAAIGQNPRNMEGRIVDSKGEPISGSNFPESGINIVPSVMKMALLKEYLQTGDKITIETSKDRKQL